MMENSNNIATCVILNDDARFKLLEGISIVAEAVGCTLGPKGKTVIIQQQGSAPIVTKDGVTVSKSIRLKDPVQRLGADLIKQAAERTNETAGDGTTTATVLTYEMIREGMKLLGSGHDAKSLCKGIDMATSEIISQLKHAARPVEGSEVEQVATISANGDHGIGKMIADAMAKVGHDGIITVEDAKGMNTTLDVVDGLQFDRGYLSPYFVTNTERMNAVYDNAKILITDKKISDLRTLIPVLESVMNSRNALLIIADDVDGEALQGLVLNRVKGNLPVIAVKAPGYGQQRDELLNDLCALTGAELVSSKTGVAIEKLKIEQLGTCKKIAVDSKTTTLVGDLDAATRVDVKLKELKERLKDVTLTVVEVSMLKSRIASLSSGVAVIKVGGATEMEMIERKYRVEDALHATKAAAEEGIVAGGGAALVQAAHRSQSCTSDDPSVKAGISVVIKACYAPLMKIIKNAGGSSDVVAEKIKQTNDPKLGPSMSSNDLINVFDAGVIDPVKVTRSALQHASSVASTFLTLDAVIYQDESNKDEQ